MVSCFSRTIRGETAEDAEQKDGTKNFSFSSALLCVSAPLRETSPPYSVTNFGHELSRNSRIESKKCWQRLLIERLESQYDTPPAPGRFFGNKQFFRIGFGLESEDLREARSVAPNLIGSQHARMV